MKEVNVTCRRLKRPTYNLKIYSFFRKTYKSIKRVFLVLHTVMYKCSRHTSSLNYDIRMERCR